MVITISKLEAIKKIIDSPSDTVKLDIMDEITLIHEPVVNINKEKGKSYINKADKVCYNDNQFFGTLSLCGVLKDNQNKIHRIMFAQQIGNNV